MIAGRCHHEMEVAVCFAAIAFGHNCFEGSCGLLERRACLVRVAVEFEEAQTQAKQAISVTVEIETELWRKGGRVRRESTVTPDHCAGPPDRICGVCGRRSVIICAAAALPSRASAAAMRSSAA